MATMTHTQEASETLNDMNQQPTHYFESLPDNTQILDLSLKAVSIEASIDQVSIDQASIDQASLKSHSAKVFSKIQCLIFSLLCITCALTVMIIWYSNWLGGNQIGITPFIHETKILNSSCQYWDIVGDGYCDDEANIEKCGYDLNDCCQMENDRTLCSNCTCFITENEAETIQNEFQTEFCQDNETIFAPTYFLGDGVCQLNLNKGELNLSNIYGNFYYYLLLLISYYHTPNESIIDITPLVTLCRVLLALVKH